MIVYLLFLEILMIVQKFSMTAALLCIALAVSIVLGAPKKEKTNLSIDGKWAVTFFGRQQTVHKSDKGIGISVSHNTSIKIDGDIIKINSDDEVANFKIISLEIDKQGKGIIDIQEASDEQSPILLGRLSLEGNRLILRISDKNKRPEDLRLSVGESGWLYSATRKSD